jgi:hypothetical protein
MKAETLIFSLDILSDVGMGQAELTPVEIKTSVTHSSRRGSKKGFHRRETALWVDGDRVWSQKQEAIPFRVG